MESIDRQTNIGKIEDEQKRKEAIRRLFII